MYFTHSAIHSIAGFFVFCTVFDIAHVYMYSCPSCHVLDKVSTYIDVEHFVYYQTLLINSRNNLLACTMKMNFVLLHNKCAVVWEGSGYPRNGIPMGVSISMLVHLVMKCTMQFIVSLNFELQ